MKNDPIEGAMERLDGVDAHSAEGKKQLQKALEGKFALVAAKAARIAGDAIATELSGPLASAFARLIARGSDGDKGCVPACEREVERLRRIEAAQFRGRWLRRANAARCASLSRIGCRRGWRA